MAEAALAEPAPTPAPEPAPAPAEPAPEPTPAPAEGSWRATLASDDAKKFAESSPDLDHLVGRALAFQKQLSGAIVPPGKDASPEDVAAYRKRLGVPESPEAYKFVLPKGVEASEDDKAFHTLMGKAFHGASVTADQAKAINAALNEASQARQEAIIQADKIYADASETENRTRWPAGEYDKNVELGNRAALKIFGDDFEAISKLETKDGRFFLDHPAVVRGLAIAGREMAEGGLIPAMSHDDAEQAQSELGDIQKRIDEAQNKGDSKEANRLYAKKLALRAKVEGSRPIVGAQGRAA